MNLLDLLLVVIVGVSVAAGFVAGFARVGIGFIAAILGRGVRLLVLRRPGGWVHQHWIHVASNLSNLLGFFMVFLAFLIAGRADRQSCSRNCSSGPGFPGSTACSAARSAWCAER